ncbi:unnamed protein product [Phytophthora lilii]|uniref:Unnamed protein product n=1 Tax=Phytophthora lilii TaxID=2077276 RepID=A0A9W6TU01_9STRA|nr:unnamed protein product [Phytophthora lilii]
MQQPSEIGQGPKQRENCSLYRHVCLRESLLRWFADHIALLAEVVKNKRPKNLVSLTKQQKAAFESLKVELSSTPILAHADFTKDFNVSVDASDLAVGGYIFQYDDEGRELTSSADRQEADPDAVRRFAQQSSNLAKLHETCRIDDGLLYFQVRPDTPRRLCNPDVVGLHNSIMFEEHDPPTRGHPGQAKTLLTLLGKYYWRGMSESVQRYVASCELCQRNKYVRGKPAGMLHPLEIPAQRWTDISMDFMTQLPPTTSGHDAVMVIVDRLTKRGHFVATRTDTARLFCEA